MNSSKTKVFSEIDLGEFERRLLAAHHLPRGAEDPLSELTRLVSTIAADRAAGAKIVELTSHNPKPEGPRDSSPEPGRAAKPEPLLSKPDPLGLEPSRASKPAPALEPELPLSFAPDPESRQENEPGLGPDLDPEPAAPAATKAAPAVSPRLEKLRARFTGFGMNQELDLAPADERREPTLQPPLTPRPSVAMVGEELDDESSDDFVALPAVGKTASADRPARSSSWYLKVGGLATLGVLMTAGAIAMKMGVTGTTKPPPLILASQSPAKVPPPNEAAVQSRDETGSLLQRDGATPMPAKIVSNEEVPIDLNAITRESQPAAPAPQPTASATADAAQATVVAPTADTQIVAPTESLGGAPPAAPSGFPAAKRVKTVSVRPDGTLISVDSATAPAVAPSPSPAPATSIPPAPNNPAPSLAAMAAAGTPPLDLPEKPAAKSAERVTAAKTATTVLPSDDEFNPPKPDVAAAGEKPAKLPTKLRPPKAAPDTATVVASNATPAAEGAGGGNWAVQLAAPRSESEAQTQVSWLKSKYADNLGSAALAVHKVEVNGETVYRVRAGGLSKADAAALCAKLKASGGDCFVARN